MVVGSCGLDDPTTVGRPPVVNWFLPTDQSVTAFVGDTLTFEVNAFHPDQSSIKQRFTLNDSVVSDQFKWNYVVADTGLSRVECLVTDGAYDTRILWEIKQEQAINLPPEIVGYTPIESQPLLVINNNMAFAISAIDPEDDPLLFEISVDGSVVATSSEYLFTATEFGQFDVEAMVSDGANSVSHIWNLTVTPVPDTIAPAEVVITALEKGAEPGEVRVEWIAVGADGMDGIASNYEVRTSPAPIVDEDTWTRATNRPGVPPPQPSGETMIMLVTGITPARYTFVAVRAVDAFGNLSPLGEVPGVHARGMRIAGKIMDAITGEPMPDVHVNIVSYHTTTDLDGNFELLELPPMNELLVVSDDNQLGLVGTHYDLRMPYQVTHLDYVIAYLIPDYQLDTYMYDDFYSFYISMTYIGGLPYPNHQRRWEPPIDIHAQPFEKEGLDYQATIHQTALDLNDFLGKDLFNVVDEDPPVGVYCHYPVDLKYDNYGVREWSPDWYPVVADIEFRRVYTPPSVSGFIRVIRHELGHALGLKHSKDTNHLMVGGIAPPRDYFSTDELAVISVLYHVPRGLNIGYYARD